MKTGGPSQGTKRRYSESSSSNVGIALKSSSLLRLPDAELEKVAGYLETSDKVNFRSTCRRAKAAADRVTEGLSKQKLEAFKAFAKGKTLVQVDRELEEAIQFMKTGNVIDNPGFPLILVARHILENNNFSSVSVVAKKDFFSPDLQIQLLDLLENSAHPLYQMRYNIYRALARNTSLCEGAQQRLANMPEEVERDCGAQKYLTSNQALVKELRMRYAQHGKDGEKLRLSWNPAIDDEEIEILRGYNDPAINYNLQDGIEQRRRYRAEQAAAASSSSNPPPQSSNI